MKKALLWTVGIIAALCLAVALIWGGELSSLGTIESVGGNPYLYRMEYKAAYDLDDVIAREIDSNAKLLEYVVGRIGKGLPIKMKSAQVADEDGETDSFGCSSFLAKDRDGDGYLFGRNYDYFKNPSLVTVSRPKKGYASIALTDLSHVGYSLDKVPDSFLKKLSCLGAIYAPVDGMNEKGLCASVHALPRQAARQDTDRPDVGTTIIIRLWLDRCATVEEALALLGTVDIKHDTAVGSGYHYMVADASGDCAIVEFDKDGNWETMIVRKPGEKNYLHFTNHLMAPKYYTTVPDQEVGNTHSRSWERYEKLGTYLEERNGILSLEEAQEALSLVHWKDFLWDDGKTVEDTQFSNVYDPSRLTLSLRHWSDYDNTVSFNL